MAVIPSEGEGPSRGIPTPSTPEILLACISTGPVLAPDLGCLHFFTYRCRLFRDITATKVLDLSDEDLMTRTKISALIALLMLVAFIPLASPPAQAQTTDTLKSIAIIGGSTAAGAYIGHKIGGTTGTWIGAGVGATAGYAIDRHRRATEYNNQYGYSSPGPYDPNGGYYGNGPYSNGGYYGGPYAGAPYPGFSQYRANNYSQNAKRQRFSPR